MPKYQVAMLSDWYKKRKARKEAPLFLRGAIALPPIGVCAVFAARYVLSLQNGFFSDDQVNFMVATLFMIAIPAFVLAGYCGWRLLQLSRASQLPLFKLLFEPVPADDER